MKNLLILIIIFIFALILRLSYLNMIPGSFHVDEVDLGYIGRYILLHGKDISGNFLPLAYDRFGDFRPTGLFYLSGLSTFLFGINEFAVRFPSALFGALTILPIYFLTKEFLTNKYSALLSSFLLAVLPWHIVLSRASSEAIIGLFFITIGLVFLIKLINSKKNHYFFLIVLFFLLSYFFYHSFRIIVPLIILPFIFFAGDYKVKIKLILLFAIFSLITILIGSSKQGNGRFNQVVFYNNPSIPNTIESLTAGEGENNILQARIFHNKIVIYSRELLNQYISYFSPSFLIFEGGYPQRYKIPEQGLIYITFTLFLFIGIYINLNINRRKSLILLFFLLISIFPAALTYEDSPNIHRSIFMIIPLIVFIASGIYKVSLMKTLPYLQLFITFFFILEFTYFLHQYSIHSSSFQSFSRNDGIKELMALIINDKNKYNKIFLSRRDNLIIYYLFYTKKFNSIEGIDPKNNNQNLLVDNLQFINTECILENIKLPKEKNILFIDNAKCKTNESLKLIKIIKRKDSTDAYKLFIN